MQLLIDGSRPAVIAVLLLLVAPQACNAIVATGAHAVKDPVSPTLEPASHKEFFGKDYPHDFQPAPNGANKKFSYPYPIVQDSGDFDKDYVKDENADSGEWKAQMEYDLIRSKIQKQRQDSEEATQAAAAQKAAYEAAKEKADAASADADAAAKEADAASKAEDETEGNLRKLIGKDAVDGRGANGANGNATGNATDGEADGSGVNGTSGEDGAIGGEVGDGVKKVENEMNGLKNCQEELAAARMKLKKSMEELEAREKAKAEHKEAMSKAEKEAEEAEEAALANASQAEKDAAAKRKANKDLTQAEIEKRDAEALAKAQAEAEAAKAKVDELEKRLKEEEEGYASADAAYEKDSKAVDAAESDLRAAAERLRKFRQADANGGVYSAKKQPHSQKNAAATPVASAALVLTLCTLLW